jgi:type I restriction enzyme R subunit
MNALLLFRIDVATYQRVYTFLSQIFDYGNTDIEKRSIFFKYLLRLLNFGRERDGVDLSQVVLTHHTLRNKGQQAMQLADDKYPELKPLSEAGSGEVREAKKSLLQDIIEQVNDLFQGELSDNDKLVYVNNVLKGKLLESETLRQQASSNSKEQFANSPDLNKELTNAIMDALEAHETMSSQALGSEDVRDGLKEILLGPAKLHELLRGSMSSAS